MTPGVKIQPTPQAEVSPADQWEEEVMTVQVEHFSLKGMCERQKSNSGLNTNQLSVSKL